MAPTPFEHGLALAWSDGALSRDGAIMLETLQKQLGLSDSERAKQEQLWLADISKNERRSFGDGDQILREWLEGLNDRQSLEPVTRSMGRAALDVGLSKSAWSEAFRFADGLGLGEELANGIWLEEEAEPLDGWPPALDPLAIILGLVIALPQVSSKQDFELADGSAFVVIRNQDAKSAPLSWMPDLVPVENENCAWGWKNDATPTTEAPDGDLVYCNSVLLAWIRRLITMRHQRGESSLDGLPDGLQVMPSSTEIERKEDTLNLSMIVDLGENGLVRPWASVTIGESIEVGSAPEGLAPNWVKIHDALGNVLVHALETLPRQLLQASGTNSDLKSVRMEEGWIVHDLDS